jgi:hypothetical protein
LANSFGKNKVATRMNVAFFSHNFLAQRTFRNCTTPKQSGKGESRWGSPSGLG